jgi:hypothetical protein
MKLFIAPAVVVIFLVAIAVLAYVGVSRQRDAIDGMHGKRFAMFRASADLVLKLTRVNEGMLKVMTYSQVGYEEDRIEKVVAEQTERLERARKVIAEVLERPYLSADERAAFKGLETPFSEYRMWSLRVMDMASSDIATAAVYLGTAELKFKNLRDVLTKLEAQEVGLSDDYYAASQVAYRWPSSTIPRESSSTVNSTCSCSATTACVWPTARIRRWWARARWR